MNSKPRTRERSRKAMTESIPVRHLLRKRPRRNVIRLEVWTKTFKHAAVGECSHEVTMLLSALLGVGTCPAREQRWALHRCYKALTGEAMPDEDT